MPEYGGVNLSSGFDACRDCLHVLQMKVFDCQTFQSSIDSFLELTLAEAH